MGQAGAEEVTEFSGEKDDWTVVSTGRHVDGVESEDVVGVTDEIVWTGVEAMGA